MIKKTIKSFAFFALIQVFIFSCCNKDYDVYYDVIEFHAIDNLDGDVTNTVASEDLILNLNPLYDYVLVSNFKNLEPLSNSAYATTCDEDYTFKETVSDVLVTANVDLLGIEAGNSLNEKLNFINPETLERESFDTVISVLNRQNGYARYDQLDFEFNETIDSNTMVQFSVQFILQENNRTLEASTENITIE